ncbi:MAG: hypothetical protein J7K98_02550 [Candidatus Aenigmarchaeota archaeon]|nr:hypothetical protein [Candidatus Aenigmarchaeota archaeon]
MTEIIRTDDWKKEKHVSLIEILEKACEEFNKYRSPEATAEFIEVKDKSFKVLFKGTFCRTCGFYDYFDDFSIFFEEKSGKKVVVKKVEELEDGAIVKFELAD